MSREPIRAVIVDDEELSREFLRDSLAGHPEVIVIAECANGFEAVKAIAELRPDLVFLDVQMPKLNGFEVLELAGDGPAVVFVTAYDQYAIKAFEVHAVETARTAKMPHNNLSFPSVSLVSLNADRAMIPITAAPIP